MAGLTLSKWGIRVVGQPTGGYWRPTEVRKAEGRRMVTWQWADSIIKDMKKGEKFLYYVQVKTAGKTELAYMLLNNQLLFDNIKDLLSTVSAEHVYLHAFCKARW